MRGTLLSILALTALAASACGYADPYVTSGPVANESPLPLPSPSPSPGADDFNAGAGLPVVTYPDGLKYIDITVGKGAVSRSLQNLTEQSTGWLTDGIPFDTSRGRAPLVFQLGVGGDIPGWDEGLPGMKVGGKRKLLIPSARAYGVNGSQQDPTTGVQAIPPNADLVFEVELTKVDPGPTPSPIPTPPPTPAPTPTPSPSPTPS